MSREVIPDQNCGCPEPPRNNNNNNNNWFPIGVILIIGFMMLSKEVHLEFDLKPKQSSSNSSNNHRAVQTSNDDAPIPLPTSTSATPTSSEKVKPVNLVKEETQTVPEELSVPLSSRKIPHLVFILDPNYGKRKNLDPNIVRSSKRVVNNYIERFAPVAVQEMNKYGIPASITLGQALLESDAGSSRLANRNNNHFGIKCFSRNCKKGHCSNHTDDSHKDFFRKYNSVWESYRSHSEFLQRKRYKHLLKLGSTDYKGWAYGLSNAGYATDKRYAPKLIKIIENLKLHKYDQ